MTVTSVAARNSDESPSAGPERPAGVSWWTVAAACSAGAGLVHAAAAGSHSSLRVLAAGFAVTAGAQVAWAVRVAVRPGPVIALAGVVLHVGALAAWAVTRLTAIGGIDGLDEIQAVGLHDGTVVAFEAAATLAIVAALVSWTVPRRLATAAIAAVLVSALPAIAVEHDHTHASSESLIAGAHDHGEPGAAPEDPLAGLGLTAAQRARAEQLIGDTKAALREYAEVEAAEAAGFRSIGDGATGFEHFVHWTYLGDGVILDPTRPESLVYWVLPDGARVLESAMYILPIGQTVSDIPTDVGPAELWHHHDDLCWGPDQRLAGRLVDGRCIPGGVHVVTPPMLHVWVVDHVCGPFAGIEGGRIPTTAEECPSHSH